MIRAGNAIILEGGDAELELIIQRGVIKAWAMINHVNPDEKLTKEMIMKELDIGKTSFQKKVVNGKYPLKMYGTPKKRFAIRSDFEGWRRNDWGRY